jgi:hypothetical protein
MTRLLEGLTVRDFASVESTNISAHDNIEAWGNIMAAVFARTTLMARRSKHVHVALPAATAALCCSSTQSFLEHYLGHVKLLLQWWTSSKNKVALLCVQVHFVFGILAQPGPVPVDPSHFVSLC